MTYNSDKCAQETIEFLFCSSCKFAFNILLIILGALKCLRFHKLLTQKKKEWMCDLILFPQTKVNFFSNYGGICFTSVNLWLFH